MIDKEKIFEELEKFRNTQEKLRSEDDYLINYNEEVQKLEELYKDKSFDIWEILPPFVVQFRENIESISNLEDINNIIEDTELKLNKLLDVRELAKVEDDIKNYEMSLSLSINKKSIIENKEEYDFLIKRYKRVDSISETLSSIRDKEGWEEYFDFYDKDYFDMSFIEILSELIKMEVLSFISLEEIKSKNLSTYEDFELFYSDEEEFYLKKLQRIDDNINHMSKELS